MIYDAQIVLQGMTSIGRFTFSAVTLHGQYTINTFFEQDIELVTLNAIFIAFFLSLGKVDLSMSQYC